jgi:hypothetical protein
MNEWLGERATQVLYRPTPGTTTGHYDAIVEICSFAGNWHFNDWTDPPRLLGQITAPGMGFQGDLRRGLLR